MGRHIMPTVVPYILYLVSQFKVPINYSPGTETVTVQYSTIQYEFNGVGTLNWDTLYIQLYTVIMEGRHYMTTRHAIHFFFCDKIPKIGKFFSINFLAQQMMPIMQITVQFSQLTTYIVILCGLDTRSAIGAPPIPPIVRNTQTTYPSC